MRPAFRRLAIAAGAAVGFALPPTDPSGAGEFQSGLTATVSLSDLAGARLERPRKGEPFRIEVALGDAATPAPPKGLALQGWIRPAARSNVECREAARGFRATGRTARGATDLNGVLFATLFRDGSLGTIDPKLDLRSSNMLAAAKFDAPPDAFAVDQRRQTAYLAFRDKGEVVAVSLLDGARHPFAEKLEGPTRIVVSAAGDVWVAEGDAGAVLRLDASGARLSRTVLGAGAPMILAAEDGLLAFTPDGRTAWFDPANGSERARLELGPVSAAALARDGALVTLDRDGANVSVRFLDRPGQTQTAALRATATALAAPNTGGLVFAYSREHGGVSIVDVARAQQIAGFETRRPVSEAAFTPNAAYFLLDDQSMAFALDLASVAIGKELKLRPIPLSQTASGTGPSLGLIAAMPPSDQAIAVNPESGTAFVLEDMPALGPAPPMNAVRLRGGVPLALAVVDRSFREFAPGRFATHARIEKSGAHELVLTTGVAGLTVCAPITVEGPPEPEDQQLRLALRLDASTGALKSRTPQSLIMDVVDRDGRAYSIESVELAIPSLAFSWATRAPARRNAQGKLEAQVTFPHPGAYAVQPIVPAGARATVTPTTVEVRE